MKLHVLLFWILIASCKEEQFNQHYNLPEKEKVASVEAKVDVKILKKFSLDTKLELPAYSNSVTEEFNLNGSTSSCKLEYQISNFDRVLNKELEIKSEYLSKYNKELSLWLTFKDNEEEVYKLKCKLINTFEIFYNKEMTEELGLIFKKEKLFKLDNHKYSF